MSTDRYLVTGAMGCIGSWVIFHLLDDGAHVVAFDLRLPLGDHWSPRGEAELRGGYPSKAAVSAGT